MQTNRGSAREAGCALAWRLCIEAGAIDREASAALAFNLCQRQEQVRIQSTRGTHAKMMGISRAMKSGGKLGCSRLMAPCSQRSHAAALASTPPAPACRRNSGPLYLPRSPHLAGASSRSPQAQATAKRPPAT